MKKHRLGRGIRDEFPEKKKSTQRNSRVTLWKLVQQGCALIEGGPKKGVKRQCSRDRRGKTIDNIAHNKESNFKRTEVKRATENDFTRFSVAVFLFASENIYIQVDLNLLKEKFPVGRAS